MNCNLENRTELIADYLTSQLSEEKARAFEEHYFQCETCFEELQIAEDAMNLIEKEGPAAFASNKALRQELSRAMKAKSVPLHLPWWQSWRFAAATVAAAAMICLFALFIFFEKHEGPDFSGPNFEPNLYYEDWISETIRSRGAKLEAVLSPEIGEKFEGQQIIFKWKMTERIPLTLKILTNSEGVVLTQSPELSNYPMFIEKISPTDFESSGLYYWRLEDDEEVLYVGKFYFLKEN